jgi:hypothetical protein
MAFNESRFWMCAPSWEPRLENTAAVTRGGRPVQLLSFHRRDSAECGEIALNELRLWFLDHGFTPEPLDETMLNKGGIEASLEATDEHVGSIRLTFTIFDIRTRRFVAQHHASEWEAMVRKLGGVWGFQLLDPETMNPIAVSDFMTALRRTSACKNIAL